MTGKIDERTENIFDSETVKNETVMFIGRDEEKTLLFTPDRILSVHSYDGSVEYYEGKDWVLREGRLCLPEGSAIPCITADVYYGAPSDSFLITKHNGENAYTYWGEGKVMSRWQVSVTYTHSDKWSGYSQKSYPELYSALIKKLENGEDVTFIFYGDSITYGASSSYVYNYPPHQPPYAMLFTRQIAELYGYRVRWINTGLKNVCIAPKKDDVYGEKGVITYINTAVCGWTSAQGLENADSYLLPSVEKYGCDFFCVAFGMNDPAEPDKTAETVGDIIKKLLSAAPNAEVAAVSTMVPNPGAINGWCRQQYRQAPSLEKMAEKLRESGVNCAVADVTDVSLSMLERKSFSDYTGNNINHPNDFMSRVYAVTLLQTVIGYENLK